MPKKAAAPVIEDDAFEELEDDELEELDTDAPDEDDDEELEELGDDEPVKPVKGKKAAPAKAAAKSKKTPITPKAVDPYSNTWLLGYVEEQTGVSVDGRTFRMMLRTLAGEGIIERQVGVEKGRYSYPGGEKNAEVKAIIKAVKGGALEPKPKTVGVKKAKPADAPEADAAPAKIAKAKAKDAPVAAPVKKAAAAPAKAAPSTRKRSTK